LDSVVSVIDMIEDAQLHCMECEETVELDERQTPTPTEHRVGCGCHEQTVRHDHGLLPVDWRAGDDGEIVPCADCGTVGTLTRLETGGLYLECVGKRRSVKVATVLPESWTTIRERDRETTVGHCRADETDTYVGRGPDGEDLNTAAIGERGWLGNPYRLDDGYGREESIAAFRVDFEARLETDPVFREAVAELAGDRLGCWCRTHDADAPACHGDVIAEHADRLAALGVADAA